jgi:hypothetical protein
MPTKDSAQTLSFGQMPHDFLVRPGISVYGPDGRIDPEAVTILEIAKSYRVHVGTGHLSPKESYDLCLKGIEIGAPMVLTHPDWTRTKVPLDAQIELAGKGVIIEKCWINLRDGSIGVEEMAMTMRSVKPENICVTTDRGQEGVEYPVEALRLFILALLDNGFSPEEIKLMTQLIPSKILRL